MKKLFLFTIICLTILIGCNDNEIFESLNDNKNEKQNSFKKDYAQKTSLTQKTATTFNKMLQIKGFKESMSTIIQDDIIMLENIPLKATIFEDHVMLRTNYVFEDNIMMLTNNSIEEDDFTSTGESTFEDNIIVHSNYIFEDNIAMLSKDVVIEDNIILRASTIRDDIFKITDLENETTFESLFNSTFKNLYPEDKTSLNSILEKFPKLFFSTHSSIFQNHVSTINSHPNLVVMSTQTCNNGNNNQNSVKLTLIDNSTGENLLSNYYFRNHVASIKLKNSTGTTLACYNTSASGTTGTLTLNPLDDYLIYNNSTPIPTSAGYHLIFTYSSIYVPFSVISTYFGITSTAAIQLEAFLHNTDKSNLDFSLSKRSDYYTHSNSNFNHYITTRFRPNEKISFNPILSKGLKTYNLKLTEISTGINETIYGLDKSIDGFVVDLKSKFSMHIGINPNKPLDSNEYRLEIIATDCNGNIHSKTISFIVSNAITIDPVRF